MKGTLPELIAALQIPGNNITEIEIVYDPSMEYGQAVEFNQQIRKNKDITSIRIAHSSIIDIDRSPKAKDLTPFDTLFYGLLSYLHQNDKLVYLDLSCAFLGVEKLKQLNSALAVRNALSIKFSDIDMAAVNADENSYPHLKRCLKSSSLKSVALEELVDFPPESNKKSKRQLRFSDSDDNNVFEKRGFVMSLLYGMGSGLMSFFNACVNLVTNHPILVPLCLILAAAAVVLVCVPGVGQFLGMAGATAFASGGIASGLSTAATSFAGTSLGVYLGFPALSAASLAVTGEVLLAIASGIVAGATPLLLKGAAYLLGRVFDALADCMEKDDLLDDDENSEAHTHLQKESEDTSKTTTRVGSNPYKHDALIDDPDDNGAGLGPCHDEPISTLPKVHASPLSPPPAAPEGTPATGSGMQQPQEDEVELVLQPFPLTQDTPAANPSSCNLL